MPRYWLQVRVLMHSYVIREFRDKLVMLTSQVVHLIQRESRTEYKRNGCGTHGKYIIFVPRKVLNNGDIYIFSATYAV